jgi:hypothetical protein
MSQCRYHLTDDSRQQSRRVLPADQIEALECLVDEVERVPGVGERALGFGGEQGISEFSRGEAGRNRREKGTLGGLAMAYLCPTPQPAF